MVAPRGWASSVLDCSVLVLLRHSSLRCPNLWQMSHFLLFFCFLFLFFPLLPPLLLFPRFPPRLLLLELLLELPPSLRLSALHSSYSF